MKGSQLFGVALAIFSLVLLFAPDRIAMPTPVPPDVKQLADELSLLMSPTAINGATNDVGRDTKVLEGVLRSAANILVLDTQRRAPFYDNNESFKWVIRNIGDITYSDGWVMEQRYPRLREFLSQRMESRLREDFTRQDLVAELRLIADAFGAI